MKELVRIANADIKGTQQTYSGLAKIKGVSFGFSNAICQILNLDKQTKIGELTDEQIQKVEQLLKEPEGKVPSFMLNRQKDPDTGKNKHLFSADLKLQLELDIRRMKRIKSYKGMRHAIGQPVRGQRTKSHFRHGRTVGVMKKAAKMAVAKADAKPGGK